MSRKLKIAFVHLMRTGGTYTVSQLHADGWQIFDSWMEHLERDWTKEEAMEIASRDFDNNVVFNNHIVSWDREILQEFKNNGWLTFTIVRDPVDQLSSLYEFQSKGAIYIFSEDFPKATMQEFIENQLCNIESIKVTSKHWQIPEWWQEIDIIIHYEEDLYPILKRTFNLGDNHFNKRINSYPKKEFSDSQKKLIVESDYYKRYLSTLVQDKKILFLITSCNKNKDYRDALRKTWIRNLSHPYYFVIGDKGNPRIEEDVIYVDCGDSYADCPIKQYLSIEYVKENFDFDYLFCCDDDTYVVVNRLLESGFEEHDYYGGGPVFEQGHPNYVQGGAGIFLSRRAVESLLSYPKDGDHLKCKWSDQMVGKILHDQGIEAVYNVRFQMGHEEKMQEISRDYNRLITAHKLNPWQIEQADMDFNPFHVFDKIYWIKINSVMSTNMQEQIEDAEIEHLIKKINGDYKDAVQDAINLGYKKILILKDDDIFQFKFRDLSRYLFNEVKEWKIIALGAEAKRARIKTETTYESDSVIKASCIGLDSCYFKDFVEHEESLEKWLKGKEVIFPKRTCSSKHGQFYKGPEVIPDVELNRPIRCAMIVNNFKRGGAEIEFNEMLTRLDPKKVEWVGLATGNSFQFEISPEYKEKFPPVYAFEAHKDTAIDLEGIHLCETFEEAVLRATQNADVIIKWHVNHPIVESMPHPSIVLSNAFGRWVLHEYKNIHGNMFVGNSDHSGKLFWKNQHARTIYSGHAEERLKTHLGRDAQRNKWGFGPDDKIIGYIGRVDINKNLDTLIKTVAIMPHEYKLVMVGQPVVEVYEEIEIMLRKHLPERHFVDEWSHHVGDALLGLDCFVLIGEYEGFSNAMAEAWIMDVPTVFTKCGSVMELEQKYGKIGVSVNLGVKPRHLSNKIKEAMNESNRPVVEKIGKIIREEFTIEKSAKEWEEAIQDVYKQFQLPKKIKACLLFPNIDFGGTEVWCSMLLKCSQPSLIEWHFAKPRSEEIKTNEDLLEELLPYGKFYIENENLNTKHDNLEVVENKMQLIQKISQCDVVIAWGIKDLSNWFPESFNKPVVILSTNDVGDEYHAEILKNNCHLGTHFSAPSSSSQKLFPKIIQKSVDVIPNGVVPDHVFSDKSKEQQKREWGLDPNDIVVGYVGRWAGDKNPLALGKAISALPEEFKGVYVGVVKNGPWSCNEEHYKNDMDKFMTPEDQEKRLRYVPVQKNIGDSLKGMDVLLLPSIKEGFGNVLIEAWIAGVPVVSTNVGVFKDMWQMYGNPFGQVINPHDDGDEIANAITEAINVTSDRLLEIKGHALYRFNGITIAHRWFNYLRHIVQQHKENSVEMSVNQKIHMMLRDMSPKRVARQFNREQIPPPAGKQEWTYSDVLEAIASS